MKRETLQEQWDKLTEVAAQIKESHINSFFEKHPKPDALYRINHIGEVKKIEVIGFDAWYYSNNGKGQGIYPPFLEKNKRPTKDQIMVFTEYINAIESIEPIIGIRYKDMGIGTYKFIDIIPEKGVAFSENDLESESKRRKELYAPREGHEPCRYCGKQTPVGDLIEAKIIGRGRKQVWSSYKGRYESKACITEERLRFCSGKCAGNEQMSREG